MRVAKIPLCIKQSFGHPRFLPEGRNSVKTRRLVERKAGYGTAPYSAHVSARFAGMNTGW